MKTNLEKWKELIFYFFRLGLTGFGGPLALIADMQKELVEKRSWISNDEFRQAFAAIKSMPGPVAFQTALYLGTRRINRWAGLVAGICLLIPATVMMFFLAESYQSVQASPSLVRCLIGMQTGALAMIALALRPLTRDYYKSNRFWFVVLCSFFLVFRGYFAEPVLIFSFGLIFSIYDKQKIKNKTIFEAGFSISLLCWICFKAGAFVFGTGLAMVPILENEFVASRGWLSHQEFMDALAFGQLTPGPVSVTVTFIGYKLGGLLGGGLATVAIFLPSALHQLTWFPKFVSWFSSQRWVRSFVEGATAAIVGGILVSLFSLIKSVSILQLGLFFLILILSYLKTMPSWFWILFPGLITYLFVT